jgi:hypothetical protein
MLNYHLTGIRVSPQKHEDRGIPKVVSIALGTEVKVRSILNDAGKERTVVKVTKGRYQKTIHATESLGEYLLQTDFENSASSPYNTGTKAEVDAAGGAASTATNLTAYHNSVTAATAATADGVELPSGASRETCVILNKTAITVDVWSQPPQTLDGATTAVSIPAGQFRHFFASATNAWVTCRGQYN